MIEGQPDVGRKIVKGAMWLVGLRWALRLLGFINIIILARLLEPADFGVAALALTIAGILNNLSEFRTDLALIHNADASRAHYDSAWTLMLIRGVVLAVLIAAIAHPASVFLDEPRIEPVIHVLAVVVLIESARNIGIVDYYKHLTLDLEFKLQLISRLCSFVAVVACAVLLRNYWALIAGLFAFWVTMTVLSFVMHPYRPRLALSKWRELFHFSKWLWLNGILQYLCFQTDVLILGKMTGVAATGFYSVAKRTGDLVGSEFVGPVRNALFPGFVQLVKDEARFRKCFVDSFAIILAIGLPATIGFALVADLFTLAVLGEKWAPSIPVMQIMALNALLLVCIANSQSAFFALGRPDLWTGVIGLRALLVIPLLLLAIDAFGIVGAASAVTFSGGAALILALVQVKRKVGVGMGTLAAATWRSFAAIPPMAAAVLTIRAVWVPDAETILAIGQLILAIGVGGLVYGAALYALWRASGRPEGPEEHLRALIAPRLQRIRFPGLPVRRGNT